MSKLESLSEEQQLKMAETKAKWLDYIFSCQNSIDKDQVKIGVEWMYELSKQKQPIVIYVDSPLGCQYGVKLLREFVKQNTDSVWDSVGASVGASVRASVWASVGASVGASVRDSVGDSVWDSVGASVRDSVWDSVGDSVWDSVGASVRDSVRDSVGDSVWDSVGASVGASVRASVWASVGASVGASVRDSVGDSVWDSVGASVRDSVWASVGDSEPFSWYGNIGDYGWVSFYDFFTEIGVINNDKFNQFKKILLSGVYDMIQLDGFCIVSDLPDYISRDNQGRLHSDSRSAIHFKDGYEIYYWHGVTVPSMWILKPNTITKSDIITEKNAEKRRCLREILGGVKFFEAIGGCDLVDTDIDDKGNVMNLYQTKELDEIINKKIQFLEVTCPSTMRVYNLYPPNQKSKNVWEAKSSTFSNEKIQIRHGDVGILNLQQSFDKPILES